MQKKAVIYARVSTSRQADDDISLPSQIERCRAKADEVSADVVRVFVDEGISGRSDSRPAFRDAIEFCEISGIDFLICWSTSRFARNRVDAVLYKQRLDRAGTRVVYVTVDLDSSTDSGALLEGMLELLDEHVSRTISADTTRSIIKNARDGYWNGGTPPFGFQAVHVGVKNKKKLVHSPMEAHIVREIFRLRLGGSGAQTIAAKLTASGITNRNHKWRRSTVLTVLHSHAVIGQSVFGKRDRFKTLKPASAWVIVDSHEPIIEKEVWEQVQDSIVSPSTPGVGSAKSTYVFTGLLKCGQCGSSMQIESAKGRSERYYYYNCRAAQVDRACPPRRIHARLFDEWMVSVITDEILTTDELRVVVDEVNNHISQAAKERSRQIQMMAGSMAEIDRKLGNLYTILENLGKDAPNLQDMGPRIRALRAEKEDLAAQIIQVEKAPLPEATNTDVDEFADAICTIAATASSPTALRNFLRFFIDQLTIHENGRVEVSYHPAALLTAHRTGFAVPSGRNWLPSADSNHGPGD